MITFFRRIFSSKLGLVLTLAFVALIAIAFASSDITGTGFGGGLSGGNVAKVGDRTIATGDLRDAVRRNFEQARTQQPGLDLATFIVSGTVDDVLDQMVNGMALEEYAAELGFGTSKRLEDAEIRAIPAFAGIDGSFSQDRFEQSLSQAGLSETLLRQDIRRQLLIRQLTAPVSGIKSIPAGLALPYASLLLESREGRATFVAAAPFAAAIKVTPQALQAHFTANRARYAIPERRVVRYALFGADTLGRAGEVTAGEVAAEYKRNQSQYAARETRRLTQVVASEALARSIAAQVKSGKSLAEAARAAGLSTSQTTAASQSALAGSVGAAGARAIYAADAGSIVGPVRAPLGWLVARVNGVDRVPARSLASATPEIRSELGTRKRQEAVIDLYNRLQDQLGQGADLAEVAQENGLKLMTTPAILPNGRSVGGANFAIDQALAPVVQAAFDAGEENVGELVTIEENARYALVDVARIVPSAPPALASIRSQVEADYRRSEAAKRARNVARRIAARVEKGEDLKAAASAEGIAGFATQAIGGKRTEIAGAQGRVPPELSLLFSMAQGAVKTLETPQNTGWMVIGLDKINRGNARQQPQVVAAVSEQLARALGNEYVQSLLTAAKRELGVRIDADAVAALKRELGGVPPTP